MNRQQRLMNRAIADIAQMDSGLKPTYKGLCNSFPNMILSSGLCQAIAFVDNKAKSDKDLGRSHQKIREQALAVLISEGIVQGDCRSLPVAVANMDVQQYMLATRILLSAWVYYKRFAESMIEAETVK